MSQVSREETAGPPVLTRLVVWAWVGYWALLFVVMHVPKVPGADLVLRLGDKVLHAAAYFVLGLLGGWAALRLKRQIDARWMARWGLIYATYAAADELLQPLIGRVCQFSDWLADVLGVVAALVLICRLSSARGRRE
jgi:VanZ family protein